MKTVGAREANQRFSELLREAEAGKEIAITRKQGSVTLEESLAELGAAVPSWKTAEARFTRGHGFEKRRPLASIVFNAPVFLGLSFIAFGIVLFLRGRLILLSLQSLGPRLSTPLTGFEEALSRLFAAAAGADVAVLLSIYVLLALAVLYAGNEIVVGFGRK